MSAEALLRQIAAVPGLIERLSALNGDEAPSVPRAKREKVEESNHQSSNFTNLLTAPALKLRDSFRFEEATKKPPLAAADLLVLVVNEAEVNAVFDVLDPLDERVFRYVNDGQAYFIGKIGGRNAVVAQTNPSGVGKFGSSHTARSAIALWKPRLVIGLGVAFGTPHKCCPGKDNSKIRIGDVLVSDEILPYEHRRITDGKSDELRQKRISVADEVMKAIAETEKTWKLARLISEDAAQQQIAGCLVASPNVKIWKGPILSGAKLLDSEEEHRKLCLLFAPTCPVGGEMEGSGIADAIRMSTTMPFVVIKGVCDWGCGKTEHTKALQPAAAFAAAQFLKAAAANFVSFVATNRGAQKSNAAPFSEPTVLTKPSDISHFEELWKASEDLAEAKRNLDAASHTPEYISLAKQIDELKKQQTNLVAQQKGTKDQAEKRLQQVGEQLDGVWTWDSDTVKLDHRLLRRKVGGRLNWCTDVVGRFVTPYTLDQILRAAREDSVSFVTKTNKRKISVATQDAADDPDEGDDDDS